MDFFKKAASEFSGSSNKKQTTQNTNTQQSATTGNTDTAAPATTQQTQDYGDKAFDFVSKKAGHDFTPGQDEKITDGIRGAYEKLSGSKVDSKYSN